MKSIFKSTKVVIATIIILLILGGVITGVIAKSIHSDSKTKQKIELGEKFISDQKYEEAIIAFQEVIEIEPRYVDAYLGIATAYVALDEPDEAIDWLEQGIAAIEEEGEVIDDCEQLYIKTSEIHKESGSMDKAVDVLERGYRFTLLKLFLELIEELIGQIPDESYILLGNSYIGMVNSKNNQSEHLNNKIETTVTTTSEVNNSDSSNEASDNTIETIEVIEAIPLVEDYIIDWKDDKFEKAVRGLISKPNGEIYLSEVWYMEELTLISKEITFLDDVVNFANLQELNLSDNQISDISAITELKNLTKIYLYSNKIYDITPLKELPYLTVVYLHDNQITDISVLDELPYLIALGIGENPLSDINVVKTMIQLDSLSLSGIQLEDISFLKNFTKLQSLNLDENNINDFSILKTLTQLESLSISGIQVEDIRFLSELIKLKYLNMENCQISDINVLANLKRLEKLFLNGNKISDTSALKDLTNLTSLYLGWNQICDISPLRNLTNLTRLSMDNNQIIDISVLKYLTKLEGIDLGWNKISDCSALKDLELLEYLHIPNNYIIDWTPVAHVERLMNSGNNAKSNSGGNEIYYDREYYGWGKISDKALELRNDGSYRIYYIMNNDIYSEGIYEAYETDLNLIPFTTDLTVMSYDIDGNILRSENGSGDYVRTVYDTYYNEEIKSKIIISHELTWKEIYKDYTYNDVHYDEYTEEGYYKMTDYDVIIFFWDKECKKERNSYLYEDNKMIDQWTEQIWVRKQ